MLLILAYYDLANKAHDVCVCHLPLLNASSKVFLYISSKRSYLNHGEMYLWAMVVNLWLILFFLPLKTLPLMVNCLSHLKPSPSFNCALVIMIHLTSSCNPSPFFLCHAPIVAHSHPVSNFMVTSSHQVLRTTPFWSRSLSHSTQALNFCPRLIPLLRILIYFTPVLGIYSSHHILEMNFMMQPF